MELGRSGRAVGSSFFFFAFAFSDRGEALGRSGRALMRPRRGARCRVCLASTPIATAPTLPAFTSFVGNSRARGGCRARELRLPPDLVPPDLVPTDLVPPDLAAPPRRPTRRRRAPAAADVADFFFRLRGDRWSSGVRGEARGTGSGGTCRFMKCRKACLHR